MCGALMVGVTMSQGDRPDCSSGNDREKASSVKPRAGVYENIVEKIDIHRVEG
jgi:hypothetical protein